MALNSDDVRARLAADLAHAMQTAARDERGRIDARLAERARAYSDAAKERAIAEARQLTREADADVEDIYARCQAEITRLRSEAGAQIEDRRRRLTATLAQHATILESENAQVRAAVRAHGATLDAFFARMAAEVDPAEIARMAGGLPAPPDLDSIGSRARADAVASVLRPETTANGESSTSTASVVDGVGVMDPARVEAGWPVSGESR
jgi:hypothetical protein